MESNKYKKLAEKREENDRNDPNNFIQNRSILKISSFMLIFNRFCFYKSTKSI